MPDREGRTERQIERDLQESDTHEHEPCPAGNEASVGKEKEEAVQADIGEGCYERHEEINERLSVSQELEGWGKVQAEHHEEQPDKQRHPIRGFAPEEQQGSSTIGSHKENLKQQCTCSVEAERETHVLQTHTENAHRVAQLCIAQRKSRNEED